MIPKIIHYCWFGGKELPKLAKKCLASWKKYCPDYQIKCWNESNFDVNSNQYVKEAYENKKYAFVTDYVRLYALYNFGGVYMDTDVEVIKNIDDFLNCKGFSSFESTNLVPTGILASEKELPIIKELLEYYTNKKFINADGSFDTTPNTKTITDTFVKYGLKQNNKKQVIKDFTFYESDYFCPIDCKTKVKKITDNTYTIHWFAGSWLPYKEKLKLKLYEILGNVLGKDKTNKLIMVLKGEKNAR